MTEASKSFVIEKKSDSIKALQSVLTQCTTKKIVENVILREALHTRKITKPLTRRVITLTVLVMTIKSKERGYSMAF